MDFEGVGEGSRILCRPRYSIRISEDRLVERSPSGEFVKFEVLGWVAKSELRHYELLEVLGDSVEFDDMCPNCVTPWKCNGPHIRPCRNAPVGSPQLENYLDGLGLSSHASERIRT